MSTVKVEVQLSSEELLKAVEQLSLPDLEQFVSKVLLLQAQRQTPTRSQTEAKLLIKIDRDITCDVKAHYEELIAKRQEETLTPEEYSELLLLTEQIEKLQAQRMGYVAELARIRKISLTELMKNFNIYTPAYV